MEKFHQYKVLTNIRYVEKEGKIRLKLNNRPDIHTLLHTLPNSNWVKYDLNSKKEILLPVEPGVYAIIVTNKNKTDIAYIGSSKKLGIRFLSHKTFHFLRYALDYDYKIGVYVFLTKEMNYKSIEIDAICKFKPFLNKEIHKHIYIKYST